MSDNLKVVGRLVENVLTTFPKTRNSDSYLYYIICVEILKSNGFNIKKVTLEDALLNRKKLGLPNYETVRRSRQKVQANNPTLRGVEEVEVMRKVQEEAFREFVRG